MQENYVKLENISRNIWNYQLFSISLHYKIIDIIINNIKKE